MNQHATLYRILCVAAAVGLLLAVTARPAQAVPPLPSDFWGYVTLDGAPVADGTVVAATVNGVTFQTTTSTSSGQALYLLSVNGDDPVTGGVEGGAAGQPITFAVGGVTVAQTGVWASGSNARLDLLRTSAPATVGTVTPASGVRGTSPTITLVGSNTNFAAGVTTVSFGPGVTVNSVNVTSKTQLTANISVASNATPGSRAVTVTTGGEVASKSDGFSVLTASLDVFLPANSSGAAGSQVSIPITIPTNYTGKSIIAYNFQVTADPAVLTFEGIDKAGTLSNGWTVEERHDTPGQISVIAYGAADLGSNGVLVKLLGRVTGSNGASTPLQLAAFTFNEGTPTANRKNGVFTSSGLAVVGSVTYMTGSLPVSGTVMALSGAATMTATTGSDGLYRLPISASQSYTVTPGSARYSGGAISSLDAAYVAQCLLGRRPMTDCPANAANVSNSGGVSAYDASLIARYAVGLTTPASQVGTWLYNPAKRTYPNVQATQLDQNYQAYLRGDVTGNWGQAAVAAAAAPVGGLLVAPAAADGNGQLLAPLRLAGSLPADTLAYQFELRYDPALLQLAAVDAQDTLSGGAEVVWNEVEPGHVLLAAFAGDPLAGEGDLLRLLFTLTSADLPGALASLVASPISLNEGAAEIEVTTDYGELLGDRLYLPAVQTAPE